jgi:hypothetical protein
MLLKVEGGGSQRFRVLVIHGKMTPQGYRGAVKGAVVAKAG